MNLISLLVGVAIGISLGVMICDIVVSKTIKNAARTDHTLEFSGSIYTITERGYDGRSK
ncbi:MAG: hypothetical protein ACFFG0_02440 [Candidatus Thorarchaeota archaeon]